MKTKLVSVGLSVFFLLGSEIACNRQTSPEQTNTQGEIMNIVKITQSNFESEVLNSTQPVLLDFWASWCGPCRMLAPVLEEVAEERPDVKIGKVNVDEEEYLASQFGISSIPALIVVKDGGIIVESVGYKPKAQVLALLSEV